MKNIFYKLLFFTVTLVIGLDAKQYQNFNSKVKKHKTQNEKEKLFEDVGCRYMNKMVIDPKVEMLPARETQYFKDNQSTLLSLSEQYKKDVKKAILAPMYLEFISPVIGYGIKAAQFIKSGDFIGVYAGILRNLRWYEPDFKEDVDYAWYYAVPNKKDENMIIDGKYEGNELRFINHAQDPNTKRIDVIWGNIFYLCYVACKDIAKDEELTVSYGKGYWNSRGIIPEGLK